MRSEHEPQTGPLDKAAIEEWRRYEAANERARDAHHRETHCYRCGADVPVSGWHTPKRACERCRNAKESSK